MTENKTDDKTDDKTEDESEEKSENKRWAVDDFDEQTIRLKVPFRLIFNDNISLSRDAIATVEELQGHDVIIVSTTDGSSYEVMRGVAPSQREKTKEAFGL
ncbi:hypothetical protein Caci_3847 [Catenulispora acidiphila DSM 44928]|uniref:Uncharacterized protein n=1 Tax=Catenulispora acidiphila (strain DSM 44928 / JCM 14897 / NBRC 102108 / NRRL B-24433 / ID139908) TaxID=479433 RepID=C7QDF1_CATAD|nr:hypothetical protein [Catenulispora acidiphila]ACU72744.1 hypothetical protein Caci_3847 [Catenulispora acidiphila DSM 44928]